MAEERKFKAGDEVILKGVIEYVVDSSITSLPYNVRVNDRNYWLREDNITFSNDKTYEQGLEEGIKLAKKICNMTFEERNEVFGTNDGTNGFNIINNFTATQIKEKIEQYERLNCFEVGDVVNVNGYMKGVVTHVYNNKNLDILLHNGITRTYEPISNCRKTGSKVDISKVLEGILNDPRNKNL